jgi:hypothetical protein
MSNKKLVSISIVIAIIFIGLSWVLSGGDRSTQIESDLPLSASVDTAKITLGELDSTHEHISMLVFIDGERINFNQDKYMLKDKYVHFEDADGTTIHKHAIGITLPYFFSTLGIDLTQKCITLDTGRQYCNSPSNNKVLKVIVNGKTVEDVNSYELRHKDKILINYGDDNETNLRLKFNSVPDVPVELL